MNANLELQERYLYEGHKSISFVPDRPRDPKWIGGLLWKAMSGKVEGRRKKEAKGFKSVPRE